MDRSKANRYVGVALIAGGGVLCANPLWLQAVTIYPGTGWEFLPLFHAALSALGVVAAAAGLLTLRPVPQSPTVRQALALAVGTLVAVPGYGLAVIAVTGTDGALIVGYEARRAFVASLVVAAFLVGCWSRSRRRSVLALGLAAPVAPLAVVVLEWRSGALLEPVLELYFLLTGGPVLGVPYLGPVLFGAAFLIGFWVDTGPERSTDREAGCRAEQSTGREDDQPTAPSTRR